MQSMQTFSILILNPHMRDQKHYILGPGLSLRKHPKPEKDQKWVCYDITTDGQFIVSLKETGPHIKGPPKTLSHPRQSLRILGVPMIVSEPFQDIAPSKPAVKDLLAVMQAAA